MNIGILGAGNIGATVARHFANAGHHVLVSNSRDDSAELEALAAGIGERASAGSARQAVEFGDVVFIAIPWRNRAALHELGSFAGKTVIDATNPYRADGTIEDLGPTTTSSQEVLREVPGANVVKAFNTMYYVTLRDEAKPGGSDDRYVLFLAGDDPDAKDLVAGLIDEIGFAPVDVGPLASGRLIQPNTPLYNVPLHEAEARAKLAEGTR